MRSLHNNVAGKNERCTEHFVSRMNLLQTHPCPLVPKITRRMILHLDIFNLQYSIV